jgi:hypothetical protein
VSNRGITTEPAALFLVEEAELEALVSLEDPVPVGTLVTVPVPADPAWLSMLLHEELVDPD